MTTAVRSSCTRAIIQRMPLHSDLFFYTSALLLGIVAGMRSMMAPALLAITLSRRPEFVPAILPAQWFTSRVLAVALGVASTGELVGDKLPWIPNRTSPGPLVARLVSGAITGAAVLQLGRIDPWLGATCGVIGALVGTFGGFHARRFALRVTGMRDPLIGVLEDVIAIAVVASVLTLVTG